MNNSSQAIYWGDFLGALEEHYALAASQATTKHMMYFMRILLDGLEVVGLAAAPVQNLTAKAMRQILLWLEKKKGLRRLQAATIKKFLMMVKTAINWGVDEGLLDNNPIQNVKYKVKAKYQPTPNLPPGALESLLEATNDGTYTGLMMRAAIMLAVDTGLRPNELCAAKRRNMNRVGRRLLIPEEDAKTSGGLVGFGEATGRALDEYLNASAMLPGVDCQDHLFKNSHGQPLSYRHWFRLLKRYCVKAGYPDVSPYWFRVFFATAHFHMGTDKETVQKAMRHKDAAMTRHYQRVSEEERAAYDLCNRSIIDQMTRKEPATVGDAGDDPAGVPT